MKVPLRSAERLRRLSRVCGRRYSSAACRHAGAAAAGGPGRGARRGQRRLHLPAPLPASRAPTASRGHGGAAGGLRTGEESLRKSCESRLARRRSPVPPRTRSPAPRCRGSGAPAPHAVGALVGRRGMPFLRRPPAGAVPEAVCQLKM